MKKKNKKTKGPEIIKFDTTATYSIPLVKNGVIRHIDNEEIVSGCIIKQNEKDGAVIVEKEGYQMKVFMDQYFDWLLYTGYIKKEI